MAHPDPVAAAAAAYPRLAALRPEAKASLFQHATLRQEPPGHVLIDPFAVCPALFLTISGEKRVFYVDENGKEVTLYDVFAGDFCSLNLVAVLAGKPFPAQAELLSFSEFVVVPAQNLRRCMREAPEVASVMYDVLYDDTFALLHVLAAVAFRRVNERLKDYLQHRADNGVVKTTHQRIANDLGTSREVISRLLKDLAQQGRIEYSRGEILLLPNAQGD